MCNSYHGIASLIASLFKHTQTSSIVNIRIDIILAQKNHNKHNKGNKTAVLTAHAQYGELARTPEKPELPGLGIEYKRFIEQCIDSFFAPCCSVKASALLCEPTP